MRLGLSPETFLPDGAKLLLIAKPPFASHIDTYAYRIHTLTHLAEARSSCYFSVANVEAADDVGGQSDILRRVRAFVVHAHRQRAVVQQRADADESLAEWIECDRV